MKIKKIGVLTGGGDCPGLNAVIRAVVKSACFEHHIETVGIQDGYEGLVNDLTTPLSTDAVSGILPRGGTILGTSNKANPFAYSMRDRHGKLTVEDRSKDCLGVIKKNKLDGLVIIGGDGTHASSARFAEMGVPIVGIPKTIDNDLDATDITFGFDSALNVATEAVDRLHTTGESHKRAMILEVMGRYAGWIALRSGIAGGGDIILIPEIPYDIGIVCEAVKARIQRGKRFTIVVVAEGAIPKGGQQVIQSVVEGSPDPIRLGGIGQVVARQIELCSGLESRVTVLGHLQRGGTPTPYDRWLATRFGAHAVDLIATGQFGRMVALKGQNIESVPLCEAISRLRRVNPESEEVRTARAVGTCFGDR